MPDENATHVHSNPFDCVDVETPLYADLPGSITLGEVLLVMFDWVAAHKASNTSTADVWKILKALVPPGVVPGTFAVAERILRAHLIDAVVVIPVCRHDCIAFYNFKSETLKHLQYADLDRCPECKELRHVTDRKGKTKESKVMYWFPSQLYWDYMFSQPNLIQHLYNDLSCSVSSVGAIRSSDGYWAKVLQNPNMNRDPRNQAVILSMDGMPLFKDQSCRSGWPIVMKSAMLPDGLCNAQANTHMIAYQASDYLEVDPVSGKFVRVKR